MEWHVKHWRELDREEVYDLLAVRTAVFVVEQNCPYQEADGRDRRAWHVFARNERGAICACLRVLETEEEIAQIGRVLTAAQARGIGLGRELLERGIQTAWARTSARRIRLEAQTYAQRFYEKLGFHRTQTPEFLEDGIPHVEMVLERLGDDGET